MNIEQLELTAAKALLMYAIRMAQAYTDNPEDLNASVIALLVRTLENHREKPINISSIY
jgi:hypothetical protein